VCADSVASYFATLVKYTLLVRVGGSVKTQLSWDRIYWLDDDDMFRPCSAIFRS